MSEHIDNRRKEDPNRKRRQQILKEIILKLHEGQDPEEVRTEFASLIDGVTAGEISEMESGLIAEGMPVEEIQRLCDVHADLFKGTVEEVHSQFREEEKPGHPVRVLKEENFAITRLLQDKIMHMVEGLGPQPTVKERFGLLEHVNLLWDIDKHYSRKENILFPYMEKYGMTAPPKVMWGVDDEIRSLIKSFKRLLQSDSVMSDDVRKAAKALNQKVADMIVKEERIMIPMLMEVLTEDEWLAIAEDSEEIGYCIVSPETRWVPKRRMGESREEADLLRDGMIRLETGFFTVDELTRLLNTLPFDITYIDQDDIVKYFSQSSERIFPRTKSVIGRSVQNCHPPSSVHMVETILAAFKAGRKDQEDFWIQMGEAFIYIRYFAIRDESGEYMGTLEVTQNIRSLLTIKGEKRLLSEDF